jgi:hypothetical protein
VGVTDAEGRVLTEGGRVMRRREPDPDEAAIVLGMFGMLDRGHGIGDITRWVNVQGVRTKCGHPFGRRRVREILLNPGTRGRSAPTASCATVTTRRSCRGTSSQRITAKLNRPDPTSVAKRRGGRPSDVALLSGVMFCAHCGGGIWHRKSGSRRYCVCG